MIFAQTSWVAWMAVTRFSGAPARSKAQAKASPQARSVGVLMRTALPASRQDDPFTVIKAGVQALMWGPPPRRARGG
jgi:hypothetical protein